MTPPPIKKVKVKPRGARPATQKGLKTLEDLLGDAPPAPPQKKKERSFIGKCIGIIRQDIKARFNGAKALAKDTPDEWEEYKRFLELARGKGKV
jgi:hypothetical protein